MLAMKKIQLFVYSIMEDNKRFKKSKIQIIINNERVKKNQK